MSLFTHLRSLTQETASDARYLIPAIKHNGRVYRGEMMTHPQVAKKHNLLGPYAKGLCEDGFVDHMGHFLDRRKAYKYAHENGLMSGNYGPPREHTELDSDRLKPESMRYPVKKG